MEKRQCYDGWWFWLFIFLAFSIFCLCIVWSSLGKAAIEKGEYKIIIDVGDNYREAAKNLEGIKCPECQDCNCPACNWYWSPYYGPLNWSNWSNWSNISPYWGSVWVNSR
jgi:hypothetical protein